MNNQFSENLKKIRKENNISQEDLAQELGVSRQSISKWENGDAYPEMDKILALCDKFNLNIDDLLHNDIKEIKREEASKKTINQYIDDFLKFITETVTLFSKMNLKSKIKCLFEQFIIIIILMIISRIIISITESLVLNVLAFIPISIRYFISNVIDSLLAIVFLLVSIIIMVHIFKTRYLNYYEETKKEKIEENNKPEEQETKKQEAKKENKIIIRDPEHSEYKFINGLFKFIIIMIKFFALCFSISICMTIIGLFTALIMSFLICKTGLFFIGIITTILASSTAAIIILLLILNFVFDRKNNKKVMIWSFIISIIMFGIGCGLTFLGTLNFEIITNDESMMETRNIEYKMSEKTYIRNYQDSINYVESDIDNIKIEYKINKYCELQKVDGEEINLWIECTNVGKPMKEFIKNINNKKIIAPTYDLEDITVYASKENIEKLKNNIEEHNKAIEKAHEESNEKRIENLEEEIETYEEEIETYKENEIKYKDKITRLEEKIEELTEE